MHSKKWERLSEFLSLARVVVWVAVIPLSYMYGWLSSVAFVAVCSLYANVASDYAAWRADRNPILYRIEEKLDRLLGDD